MDGIPFTKMSGVGNDFILIDNRAGALRGIDLAGLARGACRRRVSLGADGLILIEPPRAGGDFSMRTFNPDGGEVAMCGNAARCVARFAYAHGLAGAAMTIDTQGGPVRAWVTDIGARVQLQVTAPPSLNRSLPAGGQALTLHTVTVSGAPHAVLFYPGVVQAPTETIHQLGAAIRYHPEFPEGINANFVEVEDRHCLRQRTYERGVEAETLACGTGAAASVVIGASLGLVDSPVRVLVAGGELEVAFERQGEGFVGIFLAGAARFVAEGRLHREAYA